MLLAVMMRETNFLKRMPVYNRLHFVHKHEEKLYFHGCTSHPSVVVFIRKRGSKGILSILYEYKFI